MRDRPDVETVRLQLAHSAQAVDESDCLPVANRDLLRESGLYGAVANAPIEDAVRSALEIGKAITAGCLATGFVWGQHQGALARLRFEVELNAQHAKDSGIYGAYTDLATGTKESGIVYSGWPTHGGTVTGEFVDDGSIVLEGFAPFVTGWPWVDFLVLYFHEASLDTVACVLVSNPRTSIKSCTEQKLNLIAANASCTYHVSFNSSRISPDDFVLIGRRPASDSVEVPAYVRQYTSVLPLGVLHGIGESARNIDLELSDQIHSASDRLSEEVAQAAKSGDSAAMDAARGRLLHVTEVAAGALMKVAGSRSALYVSEASRKVREAAFIQVASTTKRDREAALTYARRVLQA